MGEVGVEGVEAASGGDVGREEGGPEVVGGPGVIDEGRGVGDALGRQGVLHGGSLVLQEVVAGDEGAVGRNGGLSEEGVYGGVDLSGLLHQAANGDLGDIELAPLEGQGQEAGVVVVAEEVAIAEGPVYARAGAGVGVEALVGDEGLVYYAALRDDAVVTCDDQVFEVGVGGGEAVDKGLDGARHVVGCLWV